MVGGVGVVGAVIVSSKLRKAWQLGGKAGSAGRKADAASGQYPTYAVSSMTGCRAA